MQVGLIPYVFLATIKVGGTWQGKLYFLITEWISKWMNQMIQLQADRYLPSDCKNMALLSTQVQCTASFGPLSQTMFKEDRQAELKLEAFSTRLQGISKVTVQCSLFQILFLGITEVVWSMAMVLLGETCLKGVVGTRTTKRNWDCRAQGMLGKRGWCRLERYKIAGRAPGTGLRGSTRRVGGRPEGQR